MTLSSIAALHDSAVWLASCAVGSLASYNNQTQHCQPSSLFQTAFFSALKYLLLLMIYVKQMHQIDTFLKLINNSSRENKENHYRDHGLDM